jgi:Mor family transcriptional regulator
MSEEVIKMAVKWNSEENKDPCFPCFNALCYKLQAMNDNEMIEMEKNVTAELLEYYNKVVNLHNALNEKIKDMTKKEICQIVQSEKKPFISVPVPKRTTKLNYEQAEEARQMKKAGKNKNEIAKRFKVSERTISRAINRTNAYKIGSQPTVAE